MRVSLTPKLEKFVKDKVEAGLYGDASEVVRDALRLLHEQEEFRRLKLKKLRAELAKGEADLAAGRSTRIETREELAEFFSTL